MYAVFEHKKILILTSASIAIYKMLDCVSTLKKYGASVRVVMSKESERFVSALSFESLSHQVVLCEENQSWVDGGANHISYAKWADVVVVAPATANTIAKIVQGVADNVLLATLLATKAPKLIAPAMNTQMLYAPQTQENLLRLKNMDYEVIAPRSSLLACGDDGEGALESIEEIIFRIGRVLGADAFWQGQDVIISGGGSRESIDSVRYISNHSSGKQASYLALALYMRGARVSLVSSAWPVVLPKAIKCVNVTSASEFASALHQEIDEKENKPIVLMAAALADFTPQSPVDGKIKKEQVGWQWTLHCAQTEDVLRSISSQKAHKIGFKAEFDAQRALSCAQAMLEGKDCEMVCLNVMSAENPFGGDHNAMTLLTRTNRLEVKRESKFDVSLAIADFYKAFRQEKERM